MTREQYLKRRRNEAIGIAQGILNGALDPIIGIRKLNSIGMDFENVKAFDIFVGLESETDEFPRGDDRKKYAKDLIDRLDIEANSYLIECRGIIEAACLELITVLSRTETDNM